MSRQSPSGPGVITDKFYSPVPFNAEPPGQYFVLPVIIGTLSGSILLSTSDPNAASVPLFGGPETRDGKIGKCRIFYVSDVAGGDPLEFQWSVNGVLVGTPVQVPVVVLGAVPNTYAAAAALVKGDPYTFPGAAWKAGDVVDLQLKLGALSGGNSLAGVAFEKNYP
jgi:hypothetical protein